LDDERIDWGIPFEGQLVPAFYYHFQHGRPVVRTGSKETALELEGLDPDLSILAHRRTPEVDPFFWYLSAAYGQIRIFREWTFGRNAVFRQPQAADARNDRLEEDFSNLGLFLNRLRGMPKAKNALLSALKDLYEGLSDFDVSVQGGTVQVFFTEGDYVIPAPRLSDGTLRYLCLAAILCDPEPPPLVCIEEPELGLHPDILPKVADLLVAASERTQLIVTTHSDILVDAMTERPEAVIVCEKHNHQTTMKRLDKEQLKGWLERYRLGQLWTRGELGGTRW
jgi:predicted ATPase